MGWLNALGVFLTLVGVIVLFRYGMPYRIASGGAIRLIAEQSDKSETDKDRQYRLYGIWGLVAVFLGSLLQIVASFPSK